MFFLHPASYKLRAVLSETDENRLVANLRAAHSDRIESVRAARAKAAECATNPMEQGHISLVATEFACCFVHWSDVASRQGRVLTIDTFGRVVSLMYAKDKPQDFSAANVLVKDTGVPYSKGPKGERPHMSPWCLLLQALHRLAQHTGPQDEGSYNEECVVCSALRGTPEHYRNLVEGSGCVHLHGCSSCALPWHAECARALSEIGSDKDVDEPDFVCPFCTNA
mmetsp:Transcript_11024/g.29382  ORF Transcript_11024/g.29382 Transcript_11024/m.29382 type:complete len:224 (-) Transcript_11024:44-715(-)